MEISIKLRVFDAVCRAKGTSSKKQIREATGLSWTSVCKAADALVADGILLTGTTSSAGPGRPVTALWFNPHNKLIAGFALGSESWRLVLCDLSCRIVFQRKIRAPRWRGEEHFLSELDSFLRTALAENHLKRSDLLCVGVASSGRVDPDRGRLLSLLNLGTPPEMDFPLRDRLSRRLGLPVRLAVSASSAVLAEYCFGAFAGTPNLMTVGIGVGIGTGVIVNGDPLHSAQMYTAGLPGHIHIPGNLHRCVCGRTGCLEAFAGGESLAGIARRYRIPGVKSARDLDRAAMEGEPRARKLLRKAARMDASCLAFFIQIHHPQVVVFTGGQCNPEGFFFPELLRALRHDLPEDLAEQVRMEKSTLGEFDNAVGAARLALESTFERPSGSSSAGFQR